VSVCGKNSRGLRSLPLSSKWCLVFFSLESNRVRFSMCSATSRFVFSSCTRQRNCSLLGFPYSTDYQTTDAFFNQHAFLTTSNLIAMDFRIDTLHRAEDDPDECKPDIICKKVKSPGNTKQQSPHEALNKFLG
jgi:hypothetical protein